MYDRVIKALEALDIDIAFQEYEGEEDEYIIFDIFLENETDYSEDEATTLESHVTLNYWHKSKANTKKYKQIKEVMKDHNFFFDVSTSMPRSNGLYGKNFDFIYKEDMEE